ncbi:MAG: UDP-3-O-acyl-N-acetylglucosamine deacetylase [Synergistaceae bacterium]|jgi:UDP-3-O-[3-hydroxymyristoyl] N-acetylglucosamine deacetylase|nr:UDP-3-O-acyl-N-acetylglucosamine deacetylase [Synergistaceae bacterium]
MNYRKLTQSIFRRGKGLHSGREYALSIEPSGETLSLEAGGECLPLFQLALEGTGRGSDLVFPDGKRVRTCEHVLSALTGSGVWRARLVVTGAGPEFEMPGLDGCAANLAEEIAEKSALSSDPSEALQPLKLEYPVHAGDLSRFVVALPSPSFRVTYVIDYDAAPIGTQIFDYFDQPAQGRTDYLQGIAPARTFAMRADIEALRAAGLALGGSLDNAILVDETGVETTGGLRFPDEFARHKTLDLLGDLANLGRPLVAHVVAVRAGHVQHLQLVERLRAHVAHRTI